MRWKGGRRSQNIEDRRDQRVSRAGGFRGRGRGSLLPLVMRLARTKYGIWIIAAGALVLWLSGGNLGALIGLGGVAPVEQSTGPVRQSAAEQQTVDFIAVVLADTEDTWTQLFQQAGRQYEQPRLVLFRDATRSACGLGEAAMGPFYCPGDKQVYIDLSFFDELRQRFKAPGDFAQAYVLAHEVGHHVQTLLGISAKTHAARQRLNEVEANKLSVRQELQADCFAGVWAHHAQKARNILESGDLDEALAAATAIGDDRLQKQTRGQVTPDAFTHGSSAQRARWFRTGFDTGDVARCDTFNAAKL